MSHQFKSQSQEEEMTSLRQKLLALEAELNLHEHRTQSQVEEMVVLRQKIMSMEAEMKLKNEEKEHLVNRVTSLEQELARKETQLKLKEEEQEHLVECVTSLEQELAVKENQLKLKNEEQNNMLKHINYLEQNLANKEIQMQLIKNPFDVLPSEIICEILKYLTQNELGKVAQVCQRFNKLTRNPVLWKQVNVVFYILETEILKTFVNNLPWSPTSLKVEFPCSLKQNQSLNFFDICLELQKKCPDLQELTFIGCKFSKCDTSLVDICSKFLPKLQKFILHNVEFFDCPERTDYPDKSSIKILDVSQIRSPSLMTQFSKPVFSRMPDLKKLYIQETSIYDEWFEMDVEFISQLQVLNLGNTYVGFQAFQSIKRHGLNLQELYLCDAEIGDDDVNSSKFPQLKKMCLKGTDVSDQGVVSLVQNCPSLENINLFACIVLRYRKNVYVTANPKKRGIAKSIPCKAHDE